MAYLFPPILENKGHPLAGSVKSAHNSPVISQSLNLPRFSLCRERTNVAPEFSLDSVSSLYLSRTSHPSGSKLVWSNARSDLKLLATPAPENRQCPTNVHLEVTQIIWLPVKIVCPLKRHPLLGSSSRQLSSSQPREKKRVRAWPIKSRGYEPTPRRAHALTFDWAKARVISNGTASRIM